MDIRWKAGLGFLLLTSTSVHAQTIDLAFLQTRAEVTHFEETTRYEEVMAFTDVLASSASRIHKTTFGYTNEGRALPLVVYGDVQDAGPEAVLATGKTRVFVQANIHAGEVCGKEAMLMLLRGLAAGQHAAWADSLVLLVAPIYNADGNERINLNNRRGQNGPIGGMGQRPNAQNLDLNRDHMKLDSPEARSLVRLFNRYDPHVIIDLHTTNGTRHAYHLTYSPPLHPNTPAVIDTFLRRQWLPTVTRRIQSTYGWAYYYYGNLPWQNSTAERGWYTFDHRPRFNNNYAGLRNRFGILSEAYAYASFEERVHATLYFVEEVVDFASRNAVTIRQITAEADAARIDGEALAVQARLARSAQPVEILLGEVEEGTHPYSGATYSQRLDVQRPETMYEYGHFEPTETVSAPQAYLVPPDLSGVIERLAVHGILSSALNEAGTLLVEQFHIDSTHVAERLYQGHHAQTLFGAYTQVEHELPAGTRLVLMDQPLARLAFSLLEPRSDDGFAAWGLIEAKGATYPIVRIPASQP